MYPPGVSRITCFHYVSTRGIQENNLLLKEQHDSMKAKVERLENKLVNFHAMVAENEVCRSFYRVFYHHQIWSFIKRLKSLFNDPTFKDYRKNIFKEIVEILTNLYKIKLWKYRLECVMISGVEASPGSVGEDGQRQQNQVWSLVITRDSIMNVFDLDKIFLQNCLIHTT